MVEYTDDKGKIDGAMAEIISDFLSSRGQIAKWSVYICDDSKAGKEELAEFREAGKVQSVIMDPQHGITLQFANGKRISADLTAQVDLDNRLYN